MGEQARGGVCERGVCMTVQDDVWCCVHDDTGCTTIVGWHATRVRGGGGVRRATRVCTDLGAKAPDMREMGVHMYPPSTARRCRNKAGPALSPVSLLL